MQIAAKIIAKKVNETKRTNTHIDKVMREREEKKIKTKSQRKSRNGY